jgi:GT2 family glycosyltransferase/glycosyltransferase involved in cell wall biosynthesis
LFFALLIIMMHNRNESQDAVMGIRGRVDGMQDGCVIGWALPAPRRKRCRIAVTDDNGAAVAQGFAGAPRADLAALELGRSDLAFRLVLPGCSAPRVFRVFADGVELPGSPLQAGPGQYDGDCVVDGGVLKGWVRERVPDLTAPSINVVTQQGVIVGLGQSGLDADCAWPRAAFEIELHNRCLGAGALRLRVLADSVPFAETSCDLRLLGKLDLLTQEACSGWLMAPDAMRRQLEIEVFRNDAALAVAPCNMRRQDLDDLHTGTDATGFATRFPERAGLETEAARISLRLRGTPIELFEGPYIVAGKPAAVLAAQRAASAVRRMAGIGALEKSVLETALKDFISANRAGIGFIASRQSNAAPQSQEIRLNIIIPVYGDVAATKTCIDSVLAHRIAPLDRVILIDDASPDSGMAELLDGYGIQPNLFTLRNPRNLGFIKTVNRGLAFAGSGNVLLLNSDTVVFAGAFDELAAIAGSAEDIGTVTALSNDATIFSYPGHDLVGDLADADWSTLAEVALVKNAGMAIEVPTAHGFCMLIKNAVLQKIGHFDERYGRGYCEENDFCARAADHGFRHVAAAGVLVQHRPSLSFKAEKEPLLAANLARLATCYPEYFPALRAFERQDRLRPARWALDAWRLEQARRRGTQFVLVISNYLGGGSAKAIADIEQAVGYGAAIKLSLKCREDGSIGLSAETPMFRARFAVSEIDALFKLLDAAAPSHVLVHQLLGFAEAFVRRLQDWGMEQNQFYYVHDFYSLCPRVTFIDSVGDFCNVAKTSVCERCIAIGGAHEDSRLGLAPAPHRALFARMLAKFSAVIAPSASAAGLLLRGFPDLRISVIPHPETFVLPAAQVARRLEQASPAVRQAEDAEEIVLFGALGHHKGARKLLDLAKRARMTHPGLSFRVIGYTSLDAELLAVGNVRITGGYTTEMLPVLVAEARGALALFLHEWPETYSYTLSEALSHGFVPLVPDIGAPAGRVRAMQFGVVYPFPADAPEILRLIEDVLAGRVRRFKEGARPEDFHPGPASVTQTRKILNLPVAEPVKPRHAPGMRALTYEKQASD